MKTEELLYQNCNGDYLADSLQPLQTNGGKVNRHNSTRYINISEPGNKKPLPELYKFKELCCGCSACFTVCPKSSMDIGSPVRYRFLKLSNRCETYNYTGAISMLPDEEGFLYPVIDDKECIRCYKCLSVCPYKG